MFFIGNVVNKQKTDPYGGKSNDIVTIQPLRFFLENYWIGILVLLFIGAPLIIGLYRIHQETLPASSLYQDAERHFKGDGVARDYLLAYGLALIASAQGNVKAQGLASTIEAHLTNDQIISTQNVVKLLPEALITPEPIHPLLRGWVQNLNAKPLQERLRFEAGSRVSR